MFKIAIIIFRECLEIALLLGIILAVTKSIKNSRLFIIIGSLLGVTLATIFALFLQSITAMMDGLGDEYFNVSVILLTSFFIIWTAVLMQGYNTKIKNDLNTLSREINTGKANIFMLISIVATTILREGGEILLFMYSISIAEHTAINDYAWGILVGSIGGFMVGFVLYKGLLKLATDYIFRVSNILLVLIAAGLAAEAAGILTAIGSIEICADQLWDSSWLINNNSVIGKLLHITVGYDAKPNGMQIIFYLSTISIACILLQIKKISVCYKNKQ